MGEGINLATTDNPQMRRLMDDMKDQLLLVLLRRLGGRNGVVTVPVAEVDDTGGYIVSMKVEHNAFVFLVEKKQ